MRLLMSFVSFLATQNKPSTTQTQPKTKWVTFTYVGRQAKFITKLFKNTNINIAYKTNNKIGNILIHNTHTTTNNTRDKNNKRGIIYQVTCKDCNKRYIGQTGNSFYTKFREHFNEFKHGNGCSKFAQHLLENRHSIGPIDEIMEVVHTVKKGRMMDTLEKFHIYKETKLENQINDENTITRNIL